MVYSKFQHLFKGLNENCDFTPLERIMLYKYENINTTTQFFNVQSSTTGAQTYGRLKFSKSTS